VVLVAAHAGVVGGAAAGRWSPAPTFGPR
jgi:hypothetical protein